VSDMMGSVKKALLGKVVVCPSKSGPRETRAVKAQKTDRFFRS
jgi:hypothetical protein